MKITITEYLNLINGFGPLLHARVSLTTLRAIKKVRKALEEKQDEVNSNLNDIRKRELSEHEEMKELQKYLDEKIELDCEPIQAKLLDSVELTLAELEAIEVVIVDE